MTPPRRVGDTVAVWFQENVRVGVGAGVRELLRRGAHKVEVDPGEGHEEAAAEAAMLAAWR